MDERTLKKLLRDVQAGDLSVGEALRRLGSLPYEDLGFAKIDHHRALRQGFPEVVYGEGKTPEQVRAIVERLARAGGSVLGTRISPDAAAQVLEAFPRAEYHALSRVLRVGPRPRKRSGSQVAVVSAGTSDLAVAEEAALTAEAMGCGVARIHDAGIAGLHRLLAQEDRLRKARVAIVVAGMEGALPSVVGGLVSTPVIAVPTSVGYGVAFQGLAALMAMLNSCAAGVVVVNIDNGFGAAMAAARMLRSGRSRA